MSTRKAMILPAVLIATGSWAQGPGAWKPAPPPAGCGEYTAELDLVDVSLSMLRGRRLAAAKIDLTKRLDRPEPCTYYVIAKFGVTSDIVAAGYADTEESRSRMKQVVAGLRAYAGFTNLDEAAKTAELFVLQLGAQHPVPHPITIVAYTDDIAAPSPGKVPTSLEAAFARRMGAIHLQVEDDLSDRPAAPAGARRIRVELRDTPPAVEPPKAADKHRENARPIWIASVLAGALGLLTVLYFARHRRPTGTSAPFEPSALLVSEFEEGEQGALAVLADSLGRAKRDRRVLFYDMNTPIRFSADPHTAAYVVEQGEAIPPNETLFSVTPAGGTDLFLEGQGISVEGHPVPDEGLTVNAQDGVMVKFGRRVYHLGLEDDHIKTA